MNYDKDRKLNDLLESKKNTILIVDDNPTNLAVIVDYLEEQGLNILVSQDGHSSLKRAKYAKPGLILLDVLMPGIDGYETCRRLKEDPETKDIPVIFMTALSSTEDKIKAFDIGAVDYVTKPIQPEEVRARIKLHLQLRYMSERLATQNERLKLEIKQREKIEGELKKRNTSLKKEYNKRVATQKALKQLNQDLETRVQTRTVQLKETNDLLEQEIIERKQVEVQVRQSLAEKEVLLKEIYHRVKNNLLVVCSILDMQTNFIEDIEIIKMFKNSQQRIHSMALVHEQLYLSKSLKEIDLSIYLEALVEKISDAYSILESGINLILDAESITVNIETAHSCGLMVNELVSNSLEHAFPNNRKGNIWLNFKRNSDCELVLTIKDNGVGLPEGFDIQDTDSLGLKLVNILTRQLEGNLKIERDEGTAFILTFDELNYSDRL